MIVRIITTANEFVFNNDLQVPNLKDNLIVASKKYLVYKRVFNYDESEILIFAKPVI
jgi:hypothetical protein